MDKIIYNASELCSVLGVKLSTITLMEQAADPLPYFTLPGDHTHLYPRESVSAWAARQCKTEQR